VKAQARGVRFSALIGLLCVFAMPAHGQNDTAAMPAEPQCSLPLYGWFVDAQTGNQLALSPRHAEPGAADKFCHSSGGAPELTQLPLDYQQLFPREKDTQTLVVCNKNPFRFKTSVSVSQTLIQEDDISAVLGGVASSAAQGAKHAATHSARSSGPSPTVGAVEAAPERPDFDALTDLLKSLEESYAQFLKEYAQKKATLQQDSLSCEDRVEQARALQRSADEVVNSPLLKDARTELLEGSQLVAQETDRTAQAADTKLVKYFSCLLNGEQASRTTVSSLVLAPLSAVLSDRQAFVTTETFGPYILPTEVDWSITKAPLASQIPAGGPAEDAELASTQALAPFDPATCEDALLGTGDTAKPASPAASETPEKTMKPPSKPVATKPTPAKPGTEKGSETDADTRTSTPPAPPVFKTGEFLFGAPRFIATTGVPMTFVGKKEYQQAIGGSPAQNTIQYKTNEPYQFGYGIAFANVRLVEWPWRDNSLWGTFGVTATPDNQGVSGNYFAGVSQGFWGNRVLVSVGDSFVEQQRLVNGLSVGQPVPTGISATSAIPVTKSYKQGLGIAFSFRVLTAPGSKTVKAGSAKSDATDTKDAKK
jgi:hypothetical protein